MSASDDPVKSARRLLIVNQLEQQAATFMLSGLEAQAERRFEAAADCFERAARLGNRDAQLRAFASVFCVHMFWARDVLFPRCYVCSHVCGVVDLVVFLCLIPCCVFPLCL